MHLFNEGAFFLCFFLILILRFTLAMCKKNDPLLYNYV